MRTKMTNELVCPYCGATYDKDEIEYSKKISNEMKCEKCGKIYEYDVHVFYSSWKKGDGND